LIVYAFLDHFGTARRSPAALGDGARHLWQDAQMITLTRSSEPDAKPYLFTIDRDGELSLRLTRTEAISILSLFDVESPEPLVEQAAFYGEIIIHEHE
jgi:hypothetical protein